MLVDYEYMMEEAIRADWVGMFQFLYYTRCIRVPLTKERLRLVAAYGSRAIAAKLPLHRPDVKELVDGTVVGYTLIGNWISTVRSYMLTYVHGLRTAGLTQEQVGCVLWGSVAMVIEMVEVETLWEGLREMMLIAPKMFDVIGDEEVVKEQLPKEVVPYQFWDKVTLSFMLYKGIETRCSRRLLYKKMKEEVAMYERCWGVLMRM